jgi:hypothetical protein
MEWTIGSTQGYSIVNGVRIARTFPTIPAGVDTTNPILIGPTSALASSIWVATLERIVNGQVAETIWRFDANDIPVYPGGLTSYVDPRGRTWTLSASAAIVRRTGGPTISTLPLPYRDGEQFWIRVTRNYITYENKFYHAPITVTSGDAIPTIAQMTQLGGTIVNTNPVVNDTSAVTFGAEPDGSKPFSGILDRFNIYVNTQPLFDEPIYDIRSSVMPAGIVGAPTFTEVRGHIVSVVTTGANEILVRDNNREPSNALPLVDAIPTRSPFPVIHLQSFDTDWSRDRVVNDVQLANQGGSAFQTVDPVSQAKYGPRTYQRLDFLNDNSHPEYLLERTTDLMDGYADAVMRVNSVTFRPNRSDPNLWWYALSAFLNDLVRVRYSHPTEGWGYSMVSHVQSVEHRVTIRDWEVKFELDQIEAFNRWDQGAEGTGWDGSLWDDGRWDGFETGQWNRESNWNDGRSVWR